MPRSSRAHLLALGQKYLGKQVRFTGQLLTFEENEGRKKYVYVFEVEYLEDRGGELPAKRHTQGIRVFFTEDMRQLRKGTTYRKSFTVRGKVESLEGGCLITDAKLVASGEQ